MRGRVFRFPVDASAYVPPPCDVEPEAGLTPREHNLIAFAIATGWLTLIGLVAVVRAILQVLL
jgi:hypothetical protein